MELTLKLEGLDEDAARAVATAIGEVDGVERVEPASAPAQPGTRSGGGFDLAEIAVKLAPSVVAPLFRALGALFSRPAAPSGVVVVKAGGIEIRLEYDRDHTKLPEAGAVAERLVAAARSAGQG